MTNRSHETPNLGVPRAFRGLPSPDLLLRPWSAADAPALREAIDESVEHLKPWLTWTMEEPASLEETHARLERWITQHATGEAVRYAVVPAQQPAVILGDVHLNRRDGPHPDEIGYWVRRSAARQGITSSAVARLAVHSFEARGISQLSLHCNVANIVSAAFARCLGFDEIGSATMRSPDGTERPVLRFAMALEAYRSRHAAELRERARRVRLSADWRSRAHRSASCAAYPFRRRSPGKTGS